MSTSLQTQKVRLKINLKKITMNIKFPCSLTVQIKHDNTTDSRKLFELKNGECLMGETIESECEVVFSPTKMKYEDKKVHINVFMVSMSGKVASGSVVFSLFGKEVGNVTECVQFLEKCPDKQAKIYYSFSIELLRKSERFDKTYFSEFKEEQARKKQGYNSVYIPASLKTPKNQRDKEHWKVRRSPSPSPRHELNESLVQGVIALDKHSLKQDHKHQRLYTNFSVQDQPGHQMNMTNRDRSNSKRVVRENLSNRDLIVPVSTERFRTQVQDDEQHEQIQKLRMKVRNLQRNDKGATQSLRQTKEQGERRRNKINQLETAKFQLQQALRSKEEKNRKLDKTLKDLSEQKEDCENQYRSLKTQFDLRENITKDQIRKLEDKYKQSQFQREKITEEYNRALKTFEEGEKKYQVLLKEKDRAGLQEKGRVNKKLEQQSMAYEELQKEAKELKYQLQQTNREKKQIYEAYSLSEFNLGTSKTNIDSLTAKLKSEGEKVQKLQQEIQQFKLSEIEKQQIKKKLNELSLVNGSLNENIQKKQKIIQSLEYKIKQIEEESQKRNGEKNQLNLRLNQLKKSYDHLKLTQQQKTKENESLATMNETANNRIFDLKQKLQTQKRSLDDIHRQFSSKYNNAIREKDAIFAEAEELRWQLQKQIASVNQLSLQLRSQNEEIFRLSEQILDKNEKMKKIDERQKQLSTSNDHIALENAELQRKKRELTGYCKERDNQTVDLKKKLERAERENIDLKERIKTTELLTKDKVSDLQKKLKDKEDAIQAKIVQIQGMNIQLRDSNDENGILKQTTTTSQQEISHLKDMIASNRRELDGQETLILKLKESQSSNKKVISELEAELKNRREEIQIQKKKFQKAVEEHSTFKNNCCAYLELYFNDLLREEETPSSNNLIMRNRNGLYPDQKVAALQVEYLQKHWQNGSKLRTKLSQLLQDKDVLEYEMSRLKITLQQLSKKTEIDVISERDKIKTLFTQISKKEESQREQLHKYQEILTRKEKEIEQNKSLIVKLQEQGGQMNSQIHLLINQYDSLKQENRELDEKLLQARSQEIRSRAEWEGKTKETLELFEDQIAQFRQNQFETEKKLVALEKELIQKQDIIKKYEMDHNVLTYQKEKKELRASELAMRVQQYQSDGKEYQKQLREKQREIKRMAEIIEQLGVKMRNQAQKLQEVMYKNQEHSHMIFDLTRELQKSKQQLRAQQQRFTDIDTQNKAKFDAQRLLTEKLSQQLKDQKQKNISLSSERELEKFMMTQLQHSCKIEKDVKEELKSELEKKKNVIYQLTEETTMLQYQLKQVEEQKTTVMGEKDMLNATVERLKQNVNQLRMSSRDDQQSNEQIGRLEREMEKIKSEKAQMQQFYQRSIQDLKSSLRQSKKTEASKNWKEEDLKKKLKTVEKLLQSNHPDLAIQKNRMFKQAEKEKRELYSRNESLESRVEQLEDELASSRLRIKREVEKYSSEIESMKEEMNAKDFIIRNQQAELENIAYKVNQLVNDKLRIEAELEREKTKTKKMQGDLQNEQKVFREKLKKMQEDEMKSFVGELEKRLDSSRNRRMEGNFNELQRVVVSGSYREIEDIVRSMAKDKKY